MLRALFLSLLLLFATAPADAQHNIFLGVGHGNVFPPPGGCPFVVDNGCSGSIAGQPGSTAVMYATARQPGGMINQLTGSPTDYSVQLPSVNYPSVDYYTGEYTPLTSLLDPVTNLPAGCTYAPTGGENGGPQINCVYNGTTNGTIQGLDFTRGGTTCIPLLVSGTTTGTVTITDNYWQNNGNCSVVISFSSKSAMLVTEFSSGVTNISYNTLDANPTVWPYDYGSCPVTFQSTTNSCNPTEAFLVLGAVTMMYNAFLGFRGRTMQYFLANPLTGFLFEYNLMQGCCGNNPNAHGEFLEYAGVVNGNLPAAQGLGYSIIGNTILSTTDHHNNGDGAFPAQFVSSSFMQTMTLDNNFYVAGTTGGATPQVKVTGSVTGGTFTTSVLAPVSPATVGTYGSGEYIQCLNSPNAFLFMPVYLGLSGTVSAGPGGGGNSDVNQVSNWGMTWVQSQISAGLDDGTGTSTPGIVLTVTVPTVALAIGESVAIGGSTRTVTKMSPSLNPLGVPYTGTGGAGTYEVSGSSALAAVANAIPTTPANIFPGGWTVSGTVTCRPAIVPVQGAYAFSRAWADVTTPMGQVQITNNAMDLYAYGPTAIQEVNGNFTSGSTPQNFNGTITGNTLTVNSGTAQVPGRGLLTTTAGILPGTYIISGSTPTFTLSQTYGSTVGPIAMQSASVFCTVAPTIFGGNVDLTGIYTNVNAWNSTVTGNGC